MSSNFFLSTAPSCNGQELSSWWQKMTLSSTALLTPMSIGTVLSSSPHLCV